jgi:hypothetical protein
MPYTAPPIVRHEFPELFKGAFVEIRNPILISWGEVRSIRESVPQEATEEEKGRYFVGQLIREWNIAAVDDPEGKPLPAPASAADMDRLPASVYVWLVSQVESSNGKGR